MEDGKGSLLFNAGCDARIAGLEFSARPDGYLPGGLWDQGWLHVHRFWGWDAKRPYKRLPVVTEPVDVPINAVRRVMRERPSANGHHAA